MNVVTETVGVACDVVISLGGGSAIDAGEAIAIVSTNGGEPLDFLEVGERVTPLLSHAVSRPFSQNGLLDNGQPVIEDRKPDKTSAP